MIFFYLGYEKCETWNVRVSNGEVRLFYKKQKLLFVPGFVMKNHLSATYPYIRAENSSIGCMRINHWFCKML